MYSPQSQNSLYFQNNFAFINLQSHTTRIYGRSMINSRGILKPTYCTGAPYFQFMDYHNLKYTCTILYLYANHGAGLFNYQHLPNICITQLCRQIYTSTLVLREYMGYIQYRGQYASDILIIYHQPTINDQFDPHSSTG